MVNHNTMQVSLMMHTIKDKVRKAINGNIPTHISMFWQIHSGEEVRQSFRKVWLLDEERCTVS